MSWLGGSISSLTGQLSNLTKDILTEGTEEISDPTTELQLAQEKLKSADQLNGAIKHENEKLKILNRELEEKAESSELQINNISKQYRILLEEREKEVKELKQKHHELLDFQAKSALSVQSPSSLSSSPSLSSAPRTNTGGFHVDEHDLGDTISLQHEINQLRHDVQRLHAECQHWRSVAGQLSGNQTDEERTIHTESLQLKATIQELEKKLLQEKEHHQQEVISLQDVHREKISTLKRSYKQDVGRLEKELAQLQDITHTTSVNENLGDISQAKHTLEEENKEMKLKIDSMTKQLDKLSRDLQVSETRSEKLQVSVKALKDEKKTNEVELIQLRKVKEDASNLQSQQTKSNILNSDGLDSKDLNERYAQLEEEILVLKKQNQSHVVEKDLYEQRLKSYRRRLAELQDDDDFDEDSEFLDDSELSQGRHDSVIDSNTPLDEQVRILQSQVQQYQTDIEQFEYVKSDWQLEKEALEEVLMTLRTELKQAESSLAVAQAQQGLEEVARQGNGESVSHYEDNTETEEDDASKFASQIKELLSGNQQLEEERDQLLQQMAELQEHNIHLQKETEDLNTSLYEQQTVSGDTEKMIMEKDTILKTLQQEKDDLETSLDQLDLQHQEEQTQLITIKDNLSKKADTLVNQLKDKNEIISKLNETLSSKSENQKSEAANSVMITNLQSEIEKLTKELKQSNHQCEEYIKENEANKIKLQHGAVAVNDLHMDIRELENSMVKSKEELSKKSSKIKELNEENGKLVEENQNLEMQIEELEEEVEKWQTINEKAQIEHMTEIVESDINEECKQLQDKLQETVSKLDDAEVQKNELDKISQDLTNLVEELKSENKQLLSKVHSSSIEAEKLTAAASSQHSSHISDLETKLDAMSSEKHRLEKELDLLEQKLSTQVKHYEKYIKELEESKNMDENTLQQEHQRQAHVLHQKETEISELHSQLEEVQTELEDTKETMKSAVESQQQIANILQEKEDKIQTLVKLEGVCENQTRKITELEASLESIPELEKQVEKYKQICENLKLELEDTEELAQENTEALNERHKTLAVITDLETELSLATESIACLDDSRRKQEAVIADHVKGISLLNQKAEETRHHLESESNKCSHLEDMVAVMRQNLEQKDEELSKTHRKLSRASSFLNDDQKAGVEMDQPPDYSLPALEYPHSSDKKNSTNVVNGFDEEKLDTDQIIKVNEELDQLQQKLGDKDQIINDLQKKNSSLLKVLESKSLTKQKGAGNNIMEVQRLENELKKQATEKEQILAIMNEKSRESSTLKTEVHRLMNVVSAEKTALTKLQKDNHELTQKREDPNEDMQKAALQQLSRLIRDKDVENEALKQKNDTLLAVLQDSSAENSNNQLSMLLKEKEILSKQCATLQGQNEQMIAFVNQKHQESVTYHNEVQRLSVILEEENQRSEAIRVEYAKIVPQFEDKKQILLKLQDELIMYKQRFSEMEIKYGEMLQRSNVKDTVDVTSFNAKEDELKRIQDKYVDLQNNALEKDTKIHYLSQQSIELSNELTGKEADRTSLKKHAEHLQFQIQGMQTELLELRTENAKWNQKQSEQDSENVILKETTNKLSLSLREKELEMGGMREKCETLNNLMQDQRKDNGEGHQIHQGQVDRLVEQTDYLRQQTVNLQQERDQAIIALQQQQQDSTKLIQEVERLREKEVKLTRELDRLRTHLIQIEEGYTREALESEEREKDLRNRVAIAEEKLMSASSNVETASQHLSIQIEELKYQLQVVSSQRDSAYSQVTSMQDQCQQYVSSLANLQIVLEQFQQDKESQIASESERYIEEIQTLKKDYCSVQNTLIETQSHLDEASEGLEAAARLSQQLDRKEEALQALRDEVQLREKNLKHAEEEIKKLTSSTEAKVDKELMKNLLLGYFTTPQPKRKEVVHTIGGVLNFNSEEFLKISAGDGTGGWVPGLFKRALATGTTPPASPTQTPRKAPSLNQSFSQLFVKFLERESSPPPPVVRLPAEQMAKELQEKHHKEKDSSRPPAFNPFTAPRHVSMPLTMAGDRSTTSDSHILMASTNTPSFTPMFTTPASTDNISQPNSGRSTPQNSSSAILKDVLGAR